MRVATPLDCNALQHEVNNILQWSLANNLLLNPTKTKVLSLSRRHTVIHFTYSLGGTPIERVTVMKDLGVCLDSALSFNAHVSFIVGRAMKTLGIISRITKKFRRPACMIRLFCALVRSRLEFASVVWNSLTSTQSLSIESVQKRMIRILYDRHFQRRFYYDYEFLLKSVLLTTLSNRRFERDLIFLHRVVNGWTDANQLLNSVDFHVPCRVTRNLNVFYIQFMSKLSPLSRMQLSFNTIASSTLDIFTDLPVFRRNLASLVES
uniref:Putative jockey ele1 orf2-h 1e-120-j 4 n=1 Tax=Ixodes ricinus TaxID=34613 RepID=A0A0K8RF85_IXORI